MKSQIDAQTPNDLKLTDAPEKQREALGGGTNANAASHVEEKGGRSVQRLVLRGLSFQSNHLYSELKTAVLFC